MDPLTPIPAPDDQPALPTYESLASMVDHLMLHPGLNDQQIHDGCQLARAYGVGSVMVQPSNADLVVRLLKGSSVTPGSVVGFPHGGATTVVKIFETRDLLRRGIRDIDLVLNIGKLISREFQYIESEVLQVANACHESGATLRVVFETPHLADDLKIIACKICKRAEADFVATATGFAGEPTRDDLILLKRIAKDVCQVKASGNLDTLDSVLNAQALGATRFGLAHTAAILDEWKARLAAQAAAAKAALPSNES